MKSDYLELDKKPSQMDDEALARYIEKEYKKDKEALHDWRQEAIEDYNFVAGHQWDEEDLTYLMDNDRPVVVFNRVNTVISAILGMEANQRQETDYLPREKNDTLLTDAVKEVAKWVRDFAEIDMEEAQAFEDLLTCGLGWTETFMSYDEDLDGKVNKDRVDPMEMYPDRRAKKRNLKDRRHHTQAKPMTLMEIREKWPDADFQFTKESLESDENILNFINPADRYKEEMGRLESKEGITVLRHQWWELEEIYRIQDPQRGNIVEITKEQYAKLNEIFKAQFGGDLPKIKQKKRRYHEAFVAANQVLERKPLASQTGFTFNCVTGKRDHIYRQWYGIVRVMKDPQRWSNKFFSQIIDIIDSNSKGGVIAEEGAVADVRAFEEDWAKVDSVTWVKPGSLSNNKIMNRPVAQYPQGLDRLVQFAISAIYEVPGVNMEMLGLADRQQPGIVEESRKRSAYTILASFFDSFRFYRKESGMVMLEFIKEYLPEKRLAEVLTKELHPAIPRIKGIDLRGINIVVSESPQSDNNKLLTWSMLIQMMPHLINMGVPIPPDALEYTPLPATLVEKWKKMLAQRSQKSPEQLQAEKLALQEKIKDIEKTMSETEKNKAQAAKARKDAGLSEAKAAHERVSAGQKIVETIEGENKFGQ